MAPKQADNNLSWKDYCADIQATGKNFSALLGILATYTSAMKSLASQGTWDGAPLKDLTNNLATLAGAKTPAGGVLSALAAPAQQLGAAIVAKYTEGKTNEFAAKANEPVKAILDGLSKYIEAVKTDVVEPVRGERVEVVKLLETKTNVWAAPLDPLRITGFISYATSVDDDLDSVSASFDGYKMLISKLKTGHAALATKPASDPTAKDIVAVVTEILTALSQIETAVNTKSSAK
jgi:hypothetical protein